MTTTTEALPLHEDMDAARWAREFSALYIVSTAEGVEADQFGLMVGWFANAIMAGFDTANRRSRAALAQPQPSAPTGDSQLYAAASKKSAPDWHAGYQAGMAAGRAVEMAQPSAPSVEPAAVTPAAPAEWRKAVQEAYGWLWHINTEPMAPIPMWSPEKAAYQARKSLRELLTSAERGEAINAIAAHMDKMAGAAPTAQAPQPAKTRQIKCDKCNGKGSSFYEDQFRGPTGGHIKCSDCDGTGRLTALIGAAPLMANGLTESDGDNRHCRDCADFGPICPNSGEPCSGGVPQAATASVAELGEMVSDLRGMLTRLRQWTPPDIGDTWEDQYSEILLHVESMYDAAPQAAPVSAVLDRSDIARASAPAAVEPEPNSAAPLPAREPRQPLTEAQIDTVTQNHWTEIRRDPMAAHRAFANPMESHRAFARAIECAHGIAAAPAAQSSTKEPGHE